MKKIVICLLATILIVLCLSGCRDDKNDAKTPSDSGTVVQPVADEAEENTLTTADAGNKQEEEKTEPQPLPVEEDDDFVIIVPEDGAIGGGDLG